MRILIVEDEIELGNTLKKILEANNYLADVVYDGYDGYCYAQQEEYDIILLDVMLPEMSGYEVLSKIRNEGVKTPVIMLTAKSQLDDKLEAFGVGADDYVTKPYEAKELIARINAVLRRKSNYVPENIAVGDLKLRKNNLEIECLNNSSKISQKEYQILEILMLNKAIAISKETLINKVWGYDYDGEMSVVEVYMSTIRKKIKFLNSNVKISVIRGVGYIMEE